VYVCKCADFDIDGVFAYGSHVLAVVYEWNLTNHKMYLLNRQAGDEAVHGVYAVRMFAVHCAEMNMLIVNGTQNTADVWSLDKDGELPVGTLVGHDDILFNAVVHSHTFVLLCTIVQGGCISICWWSIWQSSVPSFLTIISKCKKASDIRHHSRNGRCVLC
jgi:hypothetical protein